MTKRLEPSEHTPNLVKKMVDLAIAVRSSSLEDSLITLVEIRASQLNGCAYCLDMHVKEAKIAGERELRLLHIPVWHESTLFSERERAAMRWTEVLTRIPQKGISNEHWDAISAEFSEQEIAELTYLIMVINAWNRQAIAFRFEPGSTDRLYGLDKAGLA
ncbi:carboxymuconolactone decarboxylase family protein [Qipengyuania sp. GH25]|uniref:Carboxymuconolactone decarboxylase family protein n=1 Tax=Qipengyuania pacifica TaxID=2860199 RepID=A0ABS7JKA9_9SPHN|nr:carboxymuconolactone decarboxylase family protein [Qipengyuania aerophila]MBX7489823.1 carboxymuconolactone decarboxylase family protein [Qipengyuania aerophila]